MEYLDRILDYRGPGDGAVGVFLAANIALSAVIGLDFLGWQKWQLGLAVLVVVLLLLLSLLKNGKRLSDIRHQMLLTLINLALTIFIMTVVG